MAETDRSSESPTGGQQPGQVVAPGQSGKPAGPAIPKEPAGPAAQNSDQAVADDDGVNWSASEFVAHEKSPGWYGSLLLIAIAVTAVIYFLTKDKISSVMVLVCALVLAIIASRKPRHLQYRLDDSGVTIGQKRHDYSAFKSFSVVPEGAFSSIVFTPLKRFAPLTTIYYAPEDEDKIIRLLSDRLPFEEHKLDAVDTMMRRIRF